MPNNLESLFTMRYNKKHKYRIFGDGWNSLPAVIATDYLAGCRVIELEHFFQYALGYRNYLHSIDTSRA